MSINSLAVIGAGAWGTALAIAFARKGLSVHLWCRDSVERQALKTRRQHHKALPGVIFPELLSIQETLSECLQQVELIVIAVPSHAFQACLTDLLTIIHTASTSNLRGIVSASKGLDPLTGQFLSQVAQPLLPNHLAYALLSGPSFAKEVAHGLPTAITLAAKNSEFLHFVHEYLFAKNFRIYTTPDLTGVEIGGAVKNVLAIAAGINDGLGFGMNARAALITRGLHEMMRLGLAVGAERDTLMGLAGVGDLILTCNDDQSRNRRFGIMLGQGLEQAVAVARIGQTVEGIGTAKLIHQLAQRYHVEMPIVTGVYAIIHQEISAKTIVDQLLNREPKQEF